MPPGLKRYWNKQNKKNSTKKATSRRNTKVPRRARRYARKAKRYASSSASPLIGFATFAGGAYGGEILTDQYIRPWMSKQKYLSNSMIGQGAVLLGGAYMLRKFTNKRGIKNLGTGAAAYMAAKGVGLLRQGLTG